MSIGADAHTENYFMMEFSILVPLDVMQDGE